MKRANILVFTIIALEKLEQLKWSVSQVILFIVYASAYFTLDYNFFPNFPTKCNKEEKPQDIFFPEVFDTN